MAVMRSTLGREPRILLGVSGSASPSVASRLRPSGRSRNRCLYCPYERHALPRARPRRRAAPASRRAAPAVTARRGRSRRAHRRVGRAPTLCPRGCALHVRLLHRHSPSLGGRGLPPHRRGTRLAKIDFGREAGAKHRRSNTVPQRLAVQPHRLFLPMTCRFGSMSCRICPWAAGLSHELRWQPSKKPAAQKGSAAPADPSRPVQSESLGMTSRPTARTAAAPGR